MPLTELIVHSGGLKIPVVRAGARSKVSYLNVPSAFDIETSSFYQWGEKRACMYCWQFGIGGLVCIGRTWQEFTALLSALRAILNLNNDKRLIVYIHNFAYEFQFLRKLIQWDKCFFTEPRKPLFCVSSGIEFRDSLKLSGGKSLEKIGEELRDFPHLRKAVGNLDYSLIRGSTTPLTQQELYYCEMDVRVLMAYIYEKMQDEQNNIARIPYTNTGYVRRYVRDMCFRTSWYRNYIKELTLTKDVYSLLVEAFAGGFTHANHNYVDLVLDNVGSFDKRSSYPSVMVTEKFPAGRFRSYEWTNAEAFEKLCETDAVIFRLEMYGVYTILDNDHPLSLSKCRWVDGRPLSTQDAKRYGIVVDNGRIVTAPYICTTCTETDYKILRRFYGCNYAAVKDIYHAPKAYLPRPIILATLKLFKDKTSLKGIVEQLVNYMISKNMINAEYGMMVTAIIKELLSYDNEKGYVDPKPPDIDAELEKYNNSPKRFLYWAWGVWITSYARYNLLRVVADCGNDHVYSDTDSDKILHPDEHLDIFRKYDEEIINKIHKAADFFQLPLEEFMPKTNNGVPQIIGTWEYEEKYKRFKTLGAKRYLVEKQDGKYAITVAGLPKGAVSYMKRIAPDPFDVFNSSLYIPATDSGKLTLFYGDEPIDGEVEDYQGNLFHYHEESYVHMESKHFTLDRSDQFAEYLLGYREVVTEEFN